MIRFHEAVLTSEAIRFLNIRKGKKYIDATIGGGGHSEAILKRKIKLLGIDCDPKALASSRKRLVSACPPSAFCWKLTKGNFAHLKEIAGNYGFSKVAGILFDLGVSTYQLKTPERGFSFDGDVLLDMRADPESAIRAYDLVNGLSKKELTRIFLKFSEEPFSIRIAQAIVKERNKQPVKTGRQLSDLVRRAVPKRKRYAKAHPATRVFQALRIAVNNELENLKAALPQARDLLEEGGRLVVISFHSLEDRIVKNFIREEGKRQTLACLTKKPIGPTEAEKETNPSSRSAKLRAAEKI